MMLLQYLLTFKVFFFFFFFFILFYIIGRHLLDFDVLVLLSTGACIYDMHFFSILAILLTESIMTMARHGIIIIT